MRKLNHEMKICLSLEQMRETHCFYVVELMPSQSAEKGEVFYAGVCKFADVFKTPDAHRNTHWRKVITDDSIVRITVLTTSDKYTDCYNELSFFVRNIRPTANVQGYQAATRTVITCIDGPKAGQTWETQERASIENGISQPSLSNHLNGRPGYQTIRGMRFKRGI